MTRSSTIIKNSQNIAVPRAPITPVKPSTGPTNQREDYLGSDDKKIIGNILQNYMNLVSIINSLFLDKSKLPAELSQLNMSNCIEFSRKLQDPNNDIKITQSEFQALKLNLQSCVTKIATYEAAIKASINDIK